MLWAEHPAASALLQFALCFTLLTSSAERGRWQQQFALLMLGMHFARGHPFSMNLKLHSHPHVLNLVSQHSKRLQVTLKKKKKKETYLKNNICFFSSLIHSLTLPFSLIPGFPVQEANFVDEHLDHENEHLENERLGGAAGKWWSCCP